MAYLKDFTLVDPVEGFGNVRVSERSPIIELKSNYGFSALRDAKTETGSGTLTSTNGELVLGTGTTSGSTVVLESLERGRYQPGTVGQAGVGARLAGELVGDQDAKWGYFGDNDGFGFGHDTNGVYLFTRSGGNDTKVYQSNWNVDSLDGEGRSGLTLDTLDGNIFQFDFTYYGYGTVIFTIINNNPDNEQKNAIVHRFNPASETSINEPNQPLRAEITNGTTTDDVALYVGGRQFSVVGRYLPTRRIGADYRLAQANVGTTFLPTVTFRKKSSREEISVKIEGFDIDTDANLLYQLRLDGTLTGASFTTPTDYDANETAIETDKSATAISNGQIIYEGIVSASGSGINSKGAASLKALQLDIPSLLPVTLCVRTFTGTATVSTALRTREEW